MSDTHVYTPIVMRDGSHSEYCLCSQCSGNRPRGKVRCACFIPGGIQCVLPMNHAEAHCYEPFMPFSTHLPATRENVESEK